jgi:ferritin-like protein
MSQYHEPIEDLSPNTRDYVRALMSLKEEVEAVDWYNQRVDTTSDEALADVLRHNMEEEMEHAAMTLEWLRRNMDGWDEPLRTYLFTTKSLLHVEEEAEGGNGGSGRSGTDLGIGRMSKE